MKVSWGSQENGWNWHVAIVPPLSLSFYPVSLLYSAAVDTERIWHNWKLKAPLIGHEEQGWAGRNRGGKSRRQDHKVLITDPELLTIKLLFIVLRYQEIHMWILRWIKSHALFLWNAITTASPANDCMPDRNVDKSELEVRLGFADNASRNKFCSSRLVSYHASHYINSAAANNDTTEHLQYWLVPRLQVEYFIVLPSSLAGLQFPSFITLSHTCLIGWRHIVINQLKDSFVHVLKECSSVCYVWAGEWVRTTRGLLTLPDQLTVVSSFSFTSAIGEVYK